MAKKIMKKQSIFLSLLIFFYMQLVASKSHDIDYHLAEPHAQAIEQSHNDCIDSVIDLLSSLEHEQNLKQSEQQNATSCRLELEDLKGSKIKKKSIDPEIRQIKDETQKNNILKAELKKQEAVIAAEKESFDKVAAQVKELQTALEEKQRENEELKITYDNLKHEAAQKDLLIKENQSLIAQMQKETALMPELEEKLRVAYEANKKMELQISDAASIQEARNNQVAELQVQINQLASLQNQAIAKELKHAKNQEIFEKDKASIALIEAKMNLLVDQLTQIQKLLPEISEKKPFIPTVS